jgi:peptidoglycan/LPS O-acetylase OafA/YrhL
MKMAQHIKPLTSLRGIAALGILSHHTLRIVIPQFGETISSYTRFFDNGYLWVDFFFLLSGFILAHVYLSTFSAGVSFQNYRSFLYSRFARLYPLHLLMLLPFVGIELLKAFSSDTHPFSRTKSFTGLFASVFMLQAIDFDSPPLFDGLTYWNEPAWSISAEFITYTIFPFLLLLVFKHSRILNIMTYIVGITVLALLVQPIRGHLDVIGLPSLARCTAECMLGIITYRVYQNNLVSRKYLALPATALFIGVWIVSVMHFDWSDSLVIPAFCLLLLVASVLNGSQVGIVSKFLNSRAMTYLGLISYSTYMVHWFIQEFFRQIWLKLFNVEFGSGFNEYAFILVLFSYILIVLIAGSLAYRYIEVPMRNYLRDISFAKKYIYHDPVSLKS